MIAKGCNELSPRFNQSTPLTDVAITFNVSLIHGSGNVSSVADNGAGDYTINFTTDMPDANFAAIANATNNTGARLNPDSSVTALNPRVGSVGIQVLNSSVLADSRSVSVVIFR